jgi:molybdenum cofactor synthesis domain-containing protein
MVLHRDDQKRILKLKPVSECLSLVLSEIVPLGIEAVPIEGALGRVVSENVYSDATIPSSHTAAMDGYAVNSHNTLKASLDSPVILKIEHKIFPDDLKSFFKIDKGSTTAYAACGAPLPIGADAVIKIEETNLINGKIKISRPVKTWENVYREGEDIRKGGLLIKKGRVIRPQDIGFLIARGKRDIKFFRKPSVAIISVGDELKALSSGDPNKIVNNYAFVIANLVTQFNGQSRILGVVPDDLKVITNRLKQALKESDIVITTGGCSVGLKDLVPEVVGSLGKPGLLFHGVKLRPGKPIGMGVVKGKPIVMLPGPIIPAVAGFYLFVVPVLSLLSGSGSGLSGAPLLKTDTAVLNDDLKAKSGLETFLLVKIRKTKNKTVATLVPKGYNILSNLVKADGFVTIPIGKGLSKGERVTVNLF